VSRQRQLKRKITEWHLNKTVKDFEMRNLLRKQSRHLSRGKKSIFFIRGRQVDHMKIERFSRRMNVKENNVLVTTSQVSWFLNIHYTLLTTIRATSTCKVYDSRQDKAKITSPDE